MNCNYDAESGLLSCTADEGEPCEACLERWKAEYDYWYAKWKAAPLSERDPEAYRQSMIDAGRGHLVRDE
jgi:hypothetical protein